MHYNYIKKHTELILREIIGEDVSDEKKRIEDELYMRGNPELYPGEHGLIARLTKNFETNCAVLQRKGHSNPKKLTVFEFYQASELIEKEAENGKQPKRAKKHK